jgi:phosphate-selective porin OprO/OprP
MATVILSAAMTTAFASAASAQTPAPSPAPITGFQDGFFVQSPDGDNRLLLGLVVQGDGRFSLDDPTPIVNTFTTRKIRPSFSGRVSRYLDFKVTPDFGNGSSLLVDGYLDIRFSTKLRVRTGKDKTPIGYELLQSDKDLWFPERSLASSLVPNRDIGVQAQGNFGGNRFFYAAGVFNGIPDATFSTSDVDTNNGKDLAGRVVVQPFATTSAPSAANGFGFQIGGSTGKEVGTLPSFKTSIGQTYFSYASTATANGRRNRVSPAVFYYYKSLGVFTEYVRSTQDVAKSTTTTSVSNSAWDVSGSFLVTGEASSYGTIRPKTTFDPAKGSWGALQVVARFAELAVDNDAFTAGLAASTASREATQFTVGANWFPSAYIKYYLNYERTTFSGGSTRPNENAIFLRVQLGF